MKRTISILAAAWIALSAQAPTTSATHKQTLHAPVEKDAPKGIQFFKGRWDKAIQKARDTDRIIFLDAYASWCGPCKMMERQTFTDEKVGAFFNAHFVNVKIDIEKHPDGMRLGRQLRVTAYPSLYFIDKNEQVVHFSLGYHRADQFMALGREALKKSGSD